MWDNWVQENVSQYSFGTKFCYLGNLAVAMRHFVSIFPLKFSATLLLFLMFSLLYINMEVQLFAYQIIE